MSDCHSLRIPPDHPALPGHFPGAPVVPGVVILDHVIAAAERAAGHALAVRALAQAKFLAPLLPDQDATIELDREGTALRFRVVRGGALLAQGAFTLAPDG